MAGRGLLVASLLVALFVGTCYASSKNITFSSLQKTLILTASPTPGQVLKGGEDKITLTWSFNTSFPAGTDSSYKTVKALLCYAPISQKERGWRKTVDRISKDKTCQFKVFAKDYTTSESTFTYLIEKDIPSATYFVRIYAYNSNKEEVAFGQTTDAHKTVNLFNIQAVSGRHATLDIASVCFSVFSVVSLAGFFYREKRNARLAKKSGAVAQRG